MLHVLAFDSTRKRMSVIVKHPLSGEVILYTKGADSAVLSVLAKKYRGRTVMKNVYEFMFQLSLKNCYLITGIILQVKFIT